MSTDRKRPIAHYSEKQSTKDHAILPVIQEFLRVEKETIETGRVIASKTVKNEVEDVSMTLDTDDVTIERVPIGEYIESGTPESRYEVVDRMSAQFLLVAIDHPTSGVLQWIKQYCNYL